MRGCRREEKARVGELVFIFAGRVLGVNMILSTAEIGASQSGGKYKEIPKNRKRLALFWSFCANDT